VKTTYRIPKPPAGNGVHQLPCKVQGVHRLSHREIIDDVADIEHQVRTDRGGAPYRNYPVSKTFRKHCNEKGTSVDEVMRGIRYPDLIKQRKTSELEKLNVKITEFRNEVAKAEREIIGQKTEKKALAGKLDELRESYTRSVRNSESNRVKFQSSVLGLREQLWKETSRTAETSGKLEELRVIKQELGSHDGRIQQFLVEIESAQMQITMLKEIAAKSNAMHMKEYPLLIESFTQRQRSQFDAIKRDLKSAQNDTSFTSRELEETTQRVNELQYEIEQQTKLNNKLTTIDRERSNELKQLEKQTRDLQEEMKALERRREEYKRHITESKRKSRSLKQVVDIAERRVADSEKSLQGSKRRLRELKEEIREEQVKCTAIWKTTIKQKALCAKTSAELQALTRKHEHYITRSKDNIDIITKKTHKYEEEKAAIETELKNLDGTLGKLDEELKELRKEASESQQMVAKQKKSLVEQAASNAETILKLAKEQLNGDEGGDSDKEEDNGC